MKEKSSQLIYAPSLNAPRIVSSTMKLKVATSILHVVDDPSALLCTRRTSWLSTSRLGASQEKDVG